MPYAETEHGKLFYTEKRGPEDGPVLVLIHGAGGSRLHWPPQMRRLSVVTVHTLDLPGHGRSEGSGCETIAGYVAAVTAFLDHCAVDSAVVIGHSMGGAVAQELALSEPDYVSSLVLIGTGARLRVDPGILEAIEHDFENAVDIVTQYAWSPDTDAALKELGRRALSDTGSQVLLGDFLACDRFDVMNRLGAIEVPALVIGGSADRLTPLTYSRFLSEQIPHAQLVVVEGAGHMVMLEQPETVGDAVEAFVCRFPPAGSTVPTPRTD
jgi:pimeloyl-ACP methyl ester carboxylesterase